MKFYPEITKEGFFKGDYINVTRITDLICIDNNFVAPYHENMTIDDMEISKQNERGFVSALHVKREFHEKSCLKIKEEQEAMDALHVIDLLDKHGTTLDSIHITIQLLSAGRHIGVRWSKAVNAINDNQKNGTGNWNIFFEVDFKKKPLDDI